MISDSLSLRLQTGNFYKTVGRVDAVGAVLIQPAIPRGEACTEEELR